ncbi:MAG: hypothetical protein ACOYJL_03895 [Tractidigestivibacter sp.]|jgi:hypothetical protein|uniref:hypothetical protein n=1 Tax=Tractidigestivibacter sp. TaxID=2847320 RepID=UPI003D922255
MDPTYDEKIAHDRLIRAAIRCGMPQEFGEALAIYLGSANAMERMATYLVEVRPSTFEEAADEAVALVEQRDLWVERKKSEYYNAKLTEFYNRPRDDDEGDYESEDGGFGEGAYGHYENIDDDNH